MKRCLGCYTRYSSSLTKCETCGVGAMLVEGFCSYAPEFSHASSGFKSTYFSELAQWEDANFWFRSRNEMILWALRKYCANFYSLLEIGCGTGYVLSGIAKAFPHAILQGSEIFTAGLHFAADRLPAVNFMQMDAQHIPFSEEFDVIGAFDVLEHIEDDERVLAQVHAALKPQGYMLLTVPQHSWLWSATDEYACHVRRYEADNLHRKIEMAGFRIIRTTSFVTILLPAMMAARFFHRKAANKKLDIEAELKISPLLNFLFYQLLRAESALIQKGVNFPVGGSRIVVSQKI